jgi:hypothetical protein
MTNPAARVLADCGAHFNAPVLVLRRFFSVNASCWRQVVRTAILIVSMHWPLGMVASVLYAFHCGSFQGLICVRKFLDTLFIRVGNCRKPLSVARLSRAVRPNLAWVFAEFVQRRFVALCSPLSITIFSHATLLSPDWMRFSQRTTIP